MVKWSGLNEHGRPWDDTWEPAEFMEKDGYEQVLAFRKKQIEQKRLRELSRLGQLTEEQRQSESEDDDFEIEEIKQLRVLRLYFNSSHQIFCKNNLEEKDNIWSNGLVLMRMENHGLILGNWQKILK